MYDASLFSKPPEAACTPSADFSAERDDSHRIGAMLQLLSTHLKLHRRVLHVGDAIYRSGEPFTHLHVLNSGACKLISTADDGRLQVLGLQFRGDWLGFAGIADSRYKCDAIAMDTSDVWSMRYDELLKVSAAKPEIMRTLQVEMSRQIGRDREALLSLCSLSADARVADFLRYWVACLARRGMRTDQITLRMTRAEIGNYLGMTLETVSRALSKMAKHKVIAFSEKGRRDVLIPDVAALGVFIQRCSEPAI